MMSGKIAEKKKTVEGEIGTPRKVKRLTVQCSDKLLQSICVTIK
jgi:hypothetical protein